jgi:ABC-type phosphate/phosphonate transport system substrate-binding protein
MAKWSVANGGWAQEQGSYHSLIPSAAKAYGLTVEGDVQNDPQKIVDALAAGKLVIAIMGKGHFTSSGHFIVLRGVTVDGKILVADPASYKRSEQEWYFDIILNEARKGAAASGAFWIIGN